MIYLIVVRHAVVATDVLLRLCMCTTVRTIPLESTRDESAEFFSR